MHDGKTMWEDDNCHPVYPLVCTVQRRQDNRRPGQQGRPGQGNHAPYPLGDTETAAMAPAGHKPRQGRLVQGKHRLRQRYQDILRRFRLVRDQR